MITVLVFILFLIYATVIFFIKKFEILFLVFILNIIFMIIFKINLKNAVKFLIKLLPFIIFTVILNIIFSNFVSAIFIGIRLILVCNITYIFSKKMTPKKLQYVIEKILIPLKLFKINTREIGIMVSISFAFIPILQKEIENFKYTLISKGFKFNLKNIIKYPNYILMPLIISIIKRTSEIEQSMLSRGYMS